VTGGLLVKPLGISRSNAQNKSIRVPQPVRRAVVLAAGRGNRLHPLASNIPKCLVEVAGELVANLDTPHKDSQFLDR